MGGPHSVQTKPAHMPAKPSITREIQTSININANQTLQVSGTSSSRGGTVNTSVRTSSVNLDLANLGLSSLHSPGDVFVYPSPTLPQPATTTPYPAIEHVEPLPPPSITPVAPPMLPPRPGVKITLEAKCESGLLDLRGTGIHKRPDGVIINKKNVNIVLAGKVEAVPPGEYREGPDGVLLYNSGNQKGSPVLVHGNPLKIHDHVIKHIDTSTITSPEHIKVEAQCVTVLLDG